MSNHHRSSPFPSCFRPSPADNHRPSPTTNPNLTTCLYNTDVGLFAISWSNSLFGRSLHLHHNHHYSFHLHMRTFPWNYKKQGSKKLNLITINKAARIFWDFSRAKYGSGPEPLSGFYVAVVIDGEFVLLVGDSPKEAYSRTGATQKRQQAPMVLRREHVYGTKLYSTKVKIGGHERSISIDCRLGEDPRLYFSIDSKRVLQIKHLKWKFRGNESIEIDGTYVQVSWDVYNWLFNEHNRDEDGYALFMFTIFHQKHSGFEQEDDCCSNRNIKSNNINGLLPWSPFHHQPQSFGSGFGFEEKKMKKKKKKKGGAGLLMRSGRSSSSSSLSSANSCSSCASSVMEWANSEDDEFMSLPYSGFSLLVYAWKAE